MQHLEEFGHHSKVMLRGDGAVVEIVLEIVSQLHGKVHVETKKMHLCGGDSLAPIGWPEHRTWKKEFRDNTHLLAHQHCCHDTY